MKEAATAGCRTATFRGADEAAIRKSIEQTLGRKSLVTNYILQIDKPGPDSKEVAVTVSVPMKAAVPNLLAFIGFGLKMR